MSYLIKIVVDVCFKVVLDSTKFSIFMSLFDLWIRMSYGMG